MVKGYKYYQTHPREHDIESVDDLLNELHNAELSGKCPQCGSVLVVFEHEDGVSGLRCPNVKCCWEFSMSDDLGKV